MTPSRTPEAFFTRDGASLVPGRWARGPWGETIGGHILGALFGWVIDGTDPDPELQPARLTVDLLRPVAMRPLQFRTSVQREGRRITLLDIHLLQDDAIVSRASALFLRRSAQPEGRVWNPAMDIPLIPDDTDVDTSAVPFILWTSGQDGPSAAPGDHSRWEQDSTRKLGWVRQVRPVVDDDELTPLVRAAFIGDLTSSLTHWGTAGLRYINADFTLALSRLPDGEYIGLAADGHHDTDGVATGAATVFDRHGPFGSSIAVALAQGAETAGPRMGNPGAGPNKP